MSNTYDAWPHEQQTSVDARGAERKSHLRPLVVNLWRVAAVLVAFLAPFVLLAFKVTDEISRHDPLAEPRLLTARIVVVGIFAFMLACNVVHWMRQLDLKRSHPNH